MEENKMRSAGQVLCDYLPIGSTENGRDAWAQEQVFGAMQEYATEACKYKNEQLIKVERVSLIAQEMAEKLSQENIVLQAKLAQYENADNKIRTYQEVMISDEEITEIAFNYGYGMDINTDKIGSAEHIAFCNGMRRGSEKMWINLNSKKDIPFNWIESLGK